MFQRMFASLPNAVNTDVSVFIVSQTTVDFPGELSVLENT